MIDQMDDSMKQLRADLGALGLSEKDIHHSDEEWEKICAEVRRRCLELRLSADALY